MTDDPITPAPDLVRKWNTEAATAPMADQRYIAIQAARWGGDQELEACVEWIHDWYGPGSSEVAFVVANLRTARRPKPPSLKEQALKEMELLETHGVHACCLGTLRRALEALDD